MRLFVRQVFGWRILIDFSGKTRVRLSSSANTPARRSGEVIMTVR